jgi:hypothetical protein
MWKVSNMGISSFAENMAERLLDLRIKGDTCGPPHGYLSDSTVIQIATVCPNLERFAYWIRFVHYEGEHDVFSETGVMALLRGCTKLKHLLLVDTPKVGLEAFELIASTHGINLCHLDVEGVPSLFGSANADRVRSHLEEQIEDTVIAEDSKRFYDWHYREQYHR